MRGGLCSHSLLAQLAGAGQGGATLGAVEVTLAARGQREATLCVTANTGEDRGQCLHIQEASSALGVPCEIGLVSRLLWPQNSLGSQKVPFASVVSTLLSV